MKQSHLKGVQTDKYRPASVETHRPRKYTTYLSILCTGDDKMYDFFTLGRLRAWERRMKAAIPAAFTTPALEPVCPKCTERASS